MLYHDAPNSSRTVSIHKVLESLGVSPTICGARTLASVSVAPWSAFDCSNGLCCCAVSGKLWVANDEIGRAGRAAALPDAHGTNCGRIRPKLLFVTKLSAIRESPAVTSSVLGSSAHAELILTWSALSSCSGRDMGDRVVFLLALTGPAFSEGDRRLFCICIIDSIRSNRSSSDDVATLGAFFLPRRDSGYMHPALRSYR